MQFPRASAKSEVASRVGFHLRKAIKLPGSLSGTTLFSDTTAIATKCRKRAELAAPQTLMNVSGGMTGDVAVNWITLVSVCAVAQGCKM